MTTAWSNWYNDLLPDLPGCLPAMLDHEIRRAAQELFRRSRIWQKTLGAMNVTAAQSTYAIDAGTGLVPVRIEEALYLGQELTLCARVQDMTAQYGPAWRTEQGTPSVITQESPALLILYKVPSESVADALQLTISVTPSDTSTGIDDAFAAQYADAIRIGTLGRMLVKPKKPWTDQALGVAYQQSFNVEIGKAVKDRSSGFGRGRQGGHTQWF